MQIDALNDYVVVKLVPPPERLGGLVMTEATKSQIECRCIGDVVAVGPRVGDAIGHGVIEEGDRIAYWFGHFCHIPALDGDNLRAIRAEHIIGKVKNDPQASAQKVKSLLDRDKRLESETSAPSRLAIASGHALP